MYEEVLPCEYSKCDVYLLKPGKAQCSYEGTNDCQAGVEYSQIAMDKTKVVIMNMEAFRESKEIEYEVQRWKKIADDWKKTAEALAIDLGKIEYAQTAYEDITDGLYDTVRARMQSTSLSQQESFDGLHDYAILLSTKAGEAQELRVAAEDSSDAENTYYWEGYEAALDFAIDSLPNYNN
jgi:glutamate synthase domain-containing protein 2